MQLVVYLQNAFKVYKYFVTNTCLLHFVSHNKLPHKIVNAVFTNTYYTVHIRLSSVIPVNCF